MWGNAYRATTVCVDTYHHRVLSGRLYNPALPAEGLRFESLVEFLLAMEDLLNETHFPQSFTAVRSFRTSSQRAAVPAGEQTATGGWPPLRCRCSSARTPAGKDLYPGWKPDGKKASAVCWNWSC